MRVYAIGDLQGCDEAFVALLDEINFCANDRLWLLGDLINRGPDSLAVLRRVKGMARQCRIVLGNHDLHFLAAYYGGRKPFPGDTFTDILNAPDVAVLADWLRRQPLLHVDADLGYAMTHAGIPHFWGLQQAQSYAEEVARVLSGRDPQVSYLTFFQQMYGNEPNHWDPSLQGMARLRVITNYLTRLRMVDSAGRMDFDYKGPLAQAPDNLHAWFQLWPQITHMPRLLFGHWASLNGVTGRDDILALDTGYVWGRELTALELISGERTCVAAHEIKSSC